MPGRPPNSSRETQVSSINCLPSMQRAIWPPACLRRPRICVIQRCSSRFASDSSLQLQRSTGAFSFFAERRLALGTGADSMFDTRERTLRMASGQQRSLEPNEHQLSLLKTAHESLLLTLVPMIDDAAFDLVMATERVTTSGKRKLTELIDVSADLLQLLLTLRAEGNLAVGVLQQAAGTSNVTLLQALNERFIAAKEHIEQILRQLPLSLDTARLQKAALALIGVGKGDDGMFVLRRAELQQIAAAQSALAGSRALASQLHDEIASLVAAVETASNAAASNAAQAITKAAIFMTIFTIVSILSAVAVMLY